MDDSERTLVIFLSMHRCGSSVTASVLQSLGMSLGPSALNEAAPSNPYGHFEAVPFLLLNRKIQELAVGFPDDLPASTAVLSRFCNSRGAWPEGLQIPDELLEEGRSLVRTLVDSGTVSGFKDPRTVLTWPFWERVLDDFPGLRVVPVSLLRSPHEIAMSLVTRRNGWCGYWTCLDVVAVHLRRQQAILASRPQPSPGLCFGSPSFWESLARVARQCGLTWNNDKSSEAFDQSCVHQVPAAIDHEAQDIFDSLCHEPAPRRGAEKDRRQVVKDARFIEALRLQQWQSTDAQLSEARAHARRADIEAGEVRRQLQDALARQSELQSRLVATQQELIEHQRNHSDVQEKLIRSQAQSLQAWQDNDVLRSRVGRFESHPLLGPALRMRRGMRKMIHATTDS